MPCSRVGRRTCVASGVIRVEREAEAAMPRPDIVPSIGSPAQHLARADTGVSVSEGSPAPGARAKRASRKHTNGMRRMPPILTPAQRGNGGFWCRESSSRGHEQATMAEQDIQLTDGYVILQHAEL
jgi:hypothetical protein